MTATEELDTGYPHTLRPELHKALTARGIDYWVAQGLTFWNCSDGRECVAYGYQANGKPRLAVKIVGITDPAQAIAATLGRGECEIETTENWLPAERYHRCKRCGAFFAVLDASHDIPPRCCPNCGRKVVDE